LFAAFVVLYFALLADASLNQSFAQ